MSIVSIKTKEPGEEKNISRAVFSPPLAGGHQDLKYAIALVEAKRERKLAALRISGPAKQAMITLFHLAERATYS